MVNKANGRFDELGFLSATQDGQLMGVTDNNAHPHSSEDGKITIVHNGIIENSVDLSSRVSKLGYKLSSETDTEVIVHLLDYELKTQFDNYGLEAFGSVTSNLKDHTTVIATGLDGIFVSRQGAPLVIGRGGKHIRFIRYSAILRGLF